MTDFKDVFGEASREFNRIVVHAYEGEILNGAPCNIGPDYRVFRLTSGSVKVKYQAPSDCDLTSERFTVYSSCSILLNSRSPIEETQIKERILEKEFSIKCYDAKIIVKKTYSKTLTTAFRDISSEESKTHDLNESIEAAATIYLTMTETQDMPVLNQTWQYFKPTSVSLSSINYNSVENDYTAGPKFETNIDYTRKMTKHEIDAEAYVTQFPWLLVIDNETKKAVKLIPAGYNINYEIDETKILKSVVYTDLGPVRKSSTTTKTSSKDFKLGPVGEDVEDPTIKITNTWIQDYLKKQGIDLPAGVPIPKISNEETVKKIQPDILVKFGDGKTSFGGEGSRKIETELEHGKKEEILNYQWTMEVKIKGQI